MTAADAPPHTPAGIYCRISDDPEASKVGVDRQAHACRRLASQRGWSTVELYIDNDISAFTGVSRPAYRRMLDDVRLGRLAAIVTWDADRLHRSTRELEDFIELIEATGTTVVTATAGTSDFATASGRMQARIKGTVARYESEHKTERVTAAHASLAEAGRWKGGPRPYGYDVGRDNVGRPLNDGLLIVIEQEATIIREAAAAIVAGGTVYGVCRDLNARGIPTAQGARWRTQTLRRILTHATVVGRREYRGEIVGDALWPAILNGEEWQALRDRLGTNPNRPLAGRSARGGRRYLLTGGIAICGICGANLHAHSRSSGRRAYNCQSGPDKEGCGGVTCAATRLDDLVITRVLDHYEHASTAHRAPPAGADVASDARSIPEGFEELARQFAEGTMTASAWQIVQAGATRLAGSEDSVPPPHLRTELLRQWAALPLEVQRERITAVLEAIVVHPTNLRGSRFDIDRIQLRWRRLGDEAACRAG